MGEDLLDRFRRAVGEFDRRVAAIGDDQWDQPTPCEGWTVRDLVRHLVYEDLWAVPLFEGATIAEVGDRYEGDILADDPVRAWQVASQGAIAAASAGGALEQTVHLSFGDFPGSEYLRQLLSDHLIHAWDLARATGSDEELDAGLVSFVDEWVRAMPEDMVRSPGVYGAAVEVPGGADEQTRFLAYVGRRA